MQLKLDREEHHACLHLTETRLAARGPPRRGIASWAGYALFQDVSAEWVAATTATAAGAILAMLADTMIPEAFEHTHNAAGLITVIGFFAAFVLSRLGGG